MKYNTILDAIFYNAFTISKKSAFVFLLDGEDKKSEISYQELYNKIADFAKIFENRFKKGDRILLCYPPGLEYIIAFYACLSKGLIAVPIYPPETRNNDRIKYIMKDCGAKLALTSRDIYFRMRNILDFSEEGLTWICTDILNEKAETSGFMPNTAYPEDIAFLQYTSGSTGKPKGVMVSHKNMITNSALIKQYYRHNEQSLQVSWLPPYHDMGLVGNIIQPVYSGITTVHMAPMSFIKKPVRWIKAISDFGMAGFITSGGPNFCYEMCCNSIADDQLNNIDLSNWRVAYCGAEQIKVETLKKFSKKFANYGFSFKNFFPVYGLAEVALMASAGIVSAGPQIRRFNRNALNQGKVEEIATSASDNYTELIGCGENLDDQKILIVNSETLKTCKSDEIGEIWIRGASVAKGYWNKSEDTIKNICAYTDDTLEGPFLRTGDLGFIFNNQLYITGRVKELIKINNQDYYPHDLEKIIEEASDYLRAGCGTAFSVNINEQDEELIVVYELQRKYYQANHSEVKERIRKAISDKLGLKAHKIIFIETSSFPKTTSGKLQRLLVKIMYLKNELKALDYECIQDEVQA